MKIDKRYINFPYVVKRIFWDIKSRLMIIVNSKFSIFNFYILSINVDDFNPRLFYKEKHHYGHYKILRKLNLSIRENEIDHGGAYFDGVYSDSEIDERFFNYKSLVVASEIRANAIIEANYKKHSISKLETICSVGPYINYVNTSISFNRILKIKKRLGSTVVVFPRHSHEKFTSAKSSDIFLETIDSLNKKYQSVLVCMYWKDIKLKRHKIFQDMGYKIVTAGHRADWNFINRLKTIITLADFSISDDVSTNLGFCINMGVPHKVVLTELEKIKLNKEKREVYEVFNSENKVITQDQIEMVNKYWGKEDIKKFNL